eukprot:2988877-Rhodomonas_salina.1
MAKEAPLDIEGSAPYPPMPSLRGARRMVLLGGCSSLRASYNKSGADAAYGATRLMLMDPIKGSSIPTSQRYKHAGSR